MLSNYIFYSDVGTLNFTETDKKILKDAYKMILLNLKNYLQQYDMKDELEYSKLFLYVTWWLF